MGTSLTQRLHLSLRQLGQGQPRAGLCSAPRGSGISVPCLLLVPWGDVTAGAARDNTGTLVWWHFPPSQPWLGTGSPGVWWVGGGFPKHSVFGSTGPKILLHLLVALMLLSSFPRATTSGAGHPLSAQLSASPLTLILPSLLAVVALPSPSPASPSRMRGTWFWLMGFLEAQGRGLGMIHAQGWGAGE